MEKSVSSSMNQKPDFYLEKSVHPEESGWTDYLEDFPFNKSDEYEQMMSSYCSSFGSSSFVSDAASYAAALNKLSNNNNNSHHVVHSSSIGDDDMKLPMKLNFKKGRNNHKFFNDDDSLEDTASSPVNSPKVADLRPFDIMNQRKTYDHISISSLGKGKESENYLEVQGEERSSMSYNGRKEECTELKKRGLCLVPLSMFFNYLG